MIKIEGAVARVVSTETATGATAADAIFLGVAAGKIRHKAGSNRRRETGLRCLTRNA